MSSKDFFRLIRPLPKSLVYRNREIHFVIMRGFSARLAVYGCKVPLVSDFTLKEYESTSRVILLQADDRETIQKIMEQIRFATDDPDVRRVMRSLMRAGYAERI